MEAGTTTTYRRTNLEKHFFIVDSLVELVRYFRFTKQPVLIEDDLDEVRFIEDLNGRRRRDAEVLSLIAANAKVGKMLDIGTYLGHSAARMAANSPLSTVYTVNIHPDELKDAGKFSTGCPEVDQIGIFYRQKGLKNVVQIFANTANWVVSDEIDNLSLVYVDGCHDTDFVYSDTKLIIDRVIRGGFILWHDCSPIYRKNFEWIDAAMRGIEMLLAEGVISGPILNVRNSWIGIWQKP